MLTRLQVPDTTDPNSSRPISSHGLLRRSWPCGKQTTPLGEIPHGLRLIAGQAIDFEDLRPSTFTPCTGTASAPGITWPYSQCPMSLKPATSPPDRSVRSRRSRCGRSSTSATNWPRPPRPADTCPIRCQVGCRRRRARHPRRRAPVSAAELYLTLGRLAGWALEHSYAAKVGDLLQLNVRPRLIPPELRDAWTRACRIPWSAIAVPSPRPALVSLISEVLGIFEPRSRATSPSPTPPDLAAPPPSTTTAATHRRRPPRTPAANARANSDERYLRPT
jgi:hypothetical protein